MTYDAVFVGASPIVIIEAAYNQKQGRKTLIIEKKAELGGAWGVLSFFGAKNVESGCHILDITSNSSQLFSFLQSKLGIRFKFWENQPLRVFEKEIFNYSSSYYLFKDLKDTFKSLRKEKKLKKKLRIVKCIYYQTMVVLKRYCSNYYYWGKKFHYFENGTAGLLNDLHNIISAYGIDIRFETNVKDILVNKDGMVSVCLDRNESILCKEVYLTSGSEIHSFKVEETVVDIPVTKRCFKHFFLNVEDIGGKPISYVHDISHEFLFRLNDVTSTVDNDWRKKNPFNRIFVILIKENVVVKDEGFIIESIIDRMMDLGFITKKAKVLGKEFVSSEVFHRGFEDVRSMPQVKFLRSTNLVKSLNSNLNRWQKVWR